MAVLQHQHQQHQPHPNPQSHQQHHQAYSLSRSPGAPKIPVVGSPVFATLDNEGYFTRRRCAEAIIPSPGSSTHKFLMHRLRLQRTVQMLSGSFDPRASLIIPQLYMSDVYTATSPQILDDLGITHILSLKSRFTILPFDSPLLSPRSPPQGTIASGSTGGMSAYESGSSNPSSRGSSASLVSATSSSGYPSTDSSLPPPTPPTPSSPNSSKSRFTAISILLEDPSDAHARSSTPSTSSSSTPSSRQSSTSSSSTSRTSPALSNSKDNSPRSNSPTPTNHTQSRKHITSTATSRLASSSSSKPSSSKSRTPPTRIPSPPSPPIPTTDLLSVLPITTSFIHSALSQKSGTNSRVLVHCDVGKSVSAAIIIGYLIKVHYFSFERAERFLKERRGRGGVDVSEGFRRQLLEWEGIVRGEIERKLWEGLCPEEQEQDEQYQTCEDEEKTDRTCRLANSTLLSSLPIPSSSSSPSSPPHPPSSPHPPQSPIAASPRSSPKPRPLTHSPIRTHTLPHSHEHSHNNHGNPCSNTHRWSPTSPLSPQIRSQVQI